jgi:hypothetical protein
MTTSRPRALALATLVIPVVMASCGKKEQAVQQATPPPTAAPTTTTLPPPPTPVPTPPPIWRTTHWGMTPDQVLAALPNEAQRLPQRADFAQPQPGSSLVAGTSDLAIPAYDADGVRFRVLFGFEADALDRVHLAVGKAGETTCGDLEKAVTAKHAAPSQRNPTGTSLRGEEVIWKRPDQTIVLACAGIAKLGFQKVTLDYLAPTKALATN